MTFSLVATAASASANSYATLAQANSYWESHLYGGEWQSAVDADETKCEKALVFATTLIDRYLVFNGARTSSSQALSWPRTGLVNVFTGTSVNSSTIPQFLIDATAEFAVYLLRKNRTEESDFAGVKAVNAGVSIQFDSGSDVSIIPDSVMTILRPYTASEIEPVGGPVKIARA